jgi:uncharacterized protein YaaQ
MYLMFLIIQNEDADILTRRLNNAGVRVTRLNTVGGFLSRGNVTCLVGVREDEVERVLEVVRKTCHTRKRYINPVPSAAEPAHLALSTPAYPLEVIVGGATVFMIPVSQFERLGRGELYAGRTQAPDPTAAHPAPAAEGVHMHMVVSIVAADDAEPVTRGLIAAGYRVTRMNTAGGFFRRGNVTLLIGVEQPQVDDVLQIIDANVRQRSQANPVESGMPMFGATVFVLEAARFERI